MEVRLQNNNQFNILIAEDNPSEQELIHRTLSHYDLSCDYFLARDGEEAVENIYQQKTENNCYSVILLDINMPKKSGIEVLSVIKNDVHLRKTPAVMLTASNDTKDKMMCYDLGAASYLVKPHDFSDFRSSITKVLDYWLKLVALPSNYMS